jgi:hypothetical protein
LGIIVVAASDGEPALSCEQMARVDVRGALDRAISKLRRQEDAEGVGTIPRSFLEAPGIILWVLTRTLVYN